MAPAAGCPAEEIFVTFVMAPSRNALRQTGRVPPGAAPAALAAGATAGFRYPLPGSPGRCRQAQVPGLTER
jgi:hypothetical protein